MISVAECSDEQQWNDTVCDLKGHPLQLWGWGGLKSAHNWGVKRVIISDDDTPIGCAQILTRSLPRPFRRLNYVPRGPVWQQGREADVLQAVADYSKQHLAGTLLTIEPDTEALPRVSGWQASANTILIPRTLILDLTKSEGDLQAAMTKKTRQYIRKSGRENIDIRRVTTREELAKCLAIYHDTAARAGFALHDDQYYYDVADKLGESSVVFAAFHESQPIAFVWLAVSAETAFELYGGMNEQGQQLRANYALKWHAITRCKEWGIVRYDMNGLLNDGISTFKQGFADHENMLAGTYDYALSPLYPVWTKALPVAKTIIRKIKR